MKRLLITCITITLLLTGCTAQLGYRFADTFIEWQLEDYVELNNDQQQQVSALIDELHVWHAQNELPKYREELAQLRTKIAENTLVYDDIDRVENKLWDFWSTVQQRVAEHADLLQQLSASQRKALIDAMQSKLEEQREEEQEEAQSELLEQIDRVSRREERIKDWTGSITEQQQTIVRQWVRERPTGGYWLNYRARWNDEFADALLSEPMDMDAINALIVEPRQLRSQAHKDYTEVRTAVRHKYLWKLHQSLTDQQRQRLLEKADEYLALLDDLIADFADK